MSQAPSPPTDSVPADPSLPAKPRLTRESLREAGALLSYLAPHRAACFVALGALVLATLLGLTFPYFVGQMVHNATHPTREIQFYWQQGVAPAAITMLAILALQSVVSYFRTVWFNSIGERAVARLRSDAYSRIIHLPMDFFLRRRVGELSSRISADVTQLQTMLISDLPQALRQTLIAIGGVAVLFTMTPKLTLVMLATFPPMLGGAMLLGRSVRKFSRLAQDRLADSAVIVEETLQGIQTVKAYANEDFETARYQSGMDAFIAAVMGGARLRAALISFIIFGIFGSIVIIIWYGCLMLERREIGLDYLTSFVLYTSFIGGALASFAETYSQLQKTVGAAQRVQEILREPVEPSIVTVLAENSPELPPRLRGLVELDSVSFHYPSQPETEVLRRVTLRAEPGQRVALVGPSGAGKSTLASLLLRLYSPTGGIIRLDGRDLASYPLQPLRRQMALVPQDVVLFGGTVFDNIAYGRPGADPESVTQAAREAHAHEFISAFPNGYQTLVGERGLRLSGGQKQRIAIARAILRDPAILILDEATSALDSESERLVQDALDRLMRGRTSFIIAHRLSTIRQCDQICVLRHGEILEHGTHETLIARPDGLYRSLCHLQFDSAA